MKTKIFVLFSIFLLSLGSAGAQENLYHHVGDTIVGRAQIYFYDWWNEVEIADSVDLCQKDGLEMGFDGPLLRYNYTNQPLEIIGLAGALLCKDIFGFLIDSTYYQEYLMLCEADTGGYHLIDSLPWNLRAPHRTLALPRHYREWPTECTGFQRDTIYLPMYEYYFQKPYIVKDSFYVGTTRYSSHQPTAEHGVYPPITTPYAYYYWDRLAIHPDPSYFGCPTLREFDYITSPFRDTILRYENDTVILHPYEWQRYSYMAFMLVFPIYQVKCSVPDSLGVRMVDSTTFELTWDGDGNVAWEAMVQKNAPVFTEDSVTWCDTTSFLMSGLDLQTDYLAFVRGICVYEGDTVRTDWTSVRFSTPDTVTTGIAEVDDQRLTLTPNPTSGRVKIVSDESMRHVWFYDMAGKEVLHMNPRSTKAEIDLADSPKGTYIVKIKTRSGEYTRKLIVQ